MTDGYSLSDFMTGAETLQPDSGSNDPADGIYEYEVGNVETKLGSKDPSQMYLVLTYILGNGEKKSDWFALPKMMGSETEKERKTMARMLRRFVDLGVPRENVNTFNFKELIGARGVFTLETRTGNNNREFQNIRSIQPGAVSAPSPQPSRQIQDRAAIPATSPAATGRSSDDDPFA